MTDEGEDRPPVYLAELAERIARDLVRISGSGAGENDAPTSRCESIWGSITRRDRLAGHEPAFYYLQLVSQAFLLRWGKFSTCHLKGRSRGERPLEDLLCQGKPFPERDFTKLTSDEPMLPSTVTSSRKFASVIV